ncbi:hypothetical protein FKM82_015488 [Ascaphus truei]
MYKNPGHIQDVSFPCMVPCAQINWTFLPSLKVSAIYSLWDPRKTAQNCQRVNYVLGENLGRSSPR